jgi:hypothetical protein
MGGRRDGWIGGPKDGRCVRYGWICGRRKRARGEYRFSSLVKKKKRENLRCLLLHRERNFFYIYDVIVKQKIKKRSVHHY